LFERIKNIPNFVERIEKDYGKSIEYFTAAELRALSLQSVNRGGNEGNAGRIQESSSGDRGAYPEAERGHEPEQVRIQPYKSTISALEVRTETEKQIVDKLTEIQNRATNARPLILARNQNELREQLTKLNIGKRYQDAIVKHFNKKEAVGFYDPASKSVIINPSKVINKSDAVAVWLHEMGIHAGLENILPAGAFNEIMEKVYDFFENEAKTNQVYKEVFDSVNNDPIYEGSDKSTKGEELLGKMGENSGEGAHRIMSSVTFGKYRRCFKGRPDN
jgi:hypothetical protein